MTTKLDLRLTIPVKNKCLGIVQSRINIDLTCTKIIIKNRINFCKHNQYFNTLKKKKLEDKFIMLY